MKLFIILILGVFLIPTAHVHADAFSDCSTQCRVEAEETCYRGDAPPNPGYSETQCIQDDFSACVDSVCNNLGDTPPPGGSDTGGNPLPNSGGSGTGTNTNPPANSGPIRIDNPIGIENLEDLINKIGGTLVSLAIPIAVIMIIWSGVQFLIAGGNAEMIGKAKKTLWWSIIGLAVIFIGKGFITLIKDILSLKDG